MLARPPVARSRRLRARGPRPIGPQLQFGHRALCFLPWPGAPGSLRVAAIDPRRARGFQAGLRKRYSDEQILEELRACAERLGRSPTMREFAADPETTVHPQTVIEHFGSVERGQARRPASCRAASRPARSSSALLRELGDELGRTPTASDLDERRAACRRSRSTGTRSAR